MHQQQQFGRWVKWWCVLSSMWLDGAVAAAGQGTCTAGTDFHASACNVCKRNEVYVESLAGCRCPNGLKTCGDVTPFNNDVITVACCISTLFIMFHVVHDVLYAKPAGGGGGHMASATVAPSSRLGPLQRPKRRMGFHRGRSRG